MFEEKDNYIEYVHICFGMLYFVHDSKHIITNTRVIFGNMQAILLFRVNCLLTVIDRTLLLNCLKYRYLTSVNRFDERSTLILINI